MITLLTGQPGNGKTAYSVWYDILGALAGSRLVYVLGIPKLKPSSIPLTPKMLSTWYETVDKIDPDDPDEIPLLKNIDEGALIVVDEVQKYWKPTGTIVAPDIAALDTHRHHGLDFVIMTQYPFLVHKVARVFVSKHLHIRNTWKGREILEWPEYQENPTSKSIMAQATITKYVLPKKAFDLYESATIHTKIKHKTPMRYYIFIGLLIFIPLAGYRLVSSFLNKADAAQIQKNMPGQAGKTSTVSPGITSSAEPVLKTTDSQHLEPVVVKPTYQNVQLVSNQYDWSQIGACMTFKGECRCYGDAGDRLVVPQDVCTAAVTSGWSGRAKQVYDPKPAKELKDTVKSEAEPTITLGIQG